MLNIKPPNRIVSFIALIVVFVGAIILSQYLSGNDAVQKIIGGLGYFGVILTAFVAGINVVVPIPAATFTPIFTAAGLSLPLIIAALALGTLIADAVGYALGHLSQPVIEKRYPRIYSLLTKLQEKYRYLILPAMFFYAAFVPFPNEVMLIPLALSGIRFIYLLVPLILGNLVHQIILVYGISQIINIFF